MTPRIILIGPMGAGKSTIGIELAHRFEIESKDTDTQIADEVGQSIADLFIEKGEEYFRIKEKEILRRNLLGGDGILSLGGGACISPDSQSAVRASGSFIVYLKISLSVVAERIGFNRDRPLLLVNPRAQWQSLMNERAPIYEDLADVTIDVDKKSVSEICDEIEVAYELRSKGVVR